LKLWIRSHGVLCSHKTWRWCITSVDGYFVFVFEKLELYVIRISLCQGNALRRDRMKPLQIIKVIHSSKLLLMFPPLM
jgi:hypothetical protein